MILQARGFAADRGYVRRPAFETLRSVFLRVPEILVMITVLSYNEEGCYQFLYYLNLRIPEIWPNYQ